MIAIAVVVVLLGIATLAALARWSRVPPVLANSAVGAPFVHAFNAVRARAYFVRDDACLRELRAARVAFTFAAEPRQRDACALRNVVRVLPGGLLRRPLYMTCDLARALDRFVKTVLEPASVRAFGQPVIQLVENGVRNCRPVEGYDSLLSEHAFANAIDVAGFVLRDGSVIDVAPGADGAHAAHRDFVREVTAGACTVFRTVLGPGFDELHGRHLHLDMGLLGGCRP